MACWVIIVVALCQFRSRAPSVFSVANITMCWFHNIHAFIVIAGPMNAKKNWVRLGIIVRHQIHISFQMLEFWYWSGIICASRDIAVGITEVDDEMDNAKHRVFKNISTGNFSRRIDPRWNGTLPRHKTYIFKVLIKFVKSKAIPVTGRGGL
jgi:hypothetical protein